MTVSGSAWGQEAEVRAGARAAAESGMNAFLAKDYEKAIDYFNRAEKLVHALPHLLFIARSHEKLGHLVQAREAYLKILREDLPAGAPPAFEDAQANAEKELEALEPRLPMVQVLVDAPEGATFEVTQDGMPIPSPLVGISRPTDPGEHTYEAQGPGFKAATSSVSIQEGEKKEVSLKLVEDPSAGSIEKKTDAGEAGGADEGPKAVSWTSPLAIGGYVALGVGVAGAVIGPVMLVSGRKMKKDGDQLFESCDPGCTDTEQGKIQDKDNKSTKRSAIGYVGIGLGAAGLVTGTVLLIINGTSGSKKSATVPHLQPVIGWNYAGLRGAF